MQEQSLLLSWQCHATLKLSYDHQKTDLLGLKKGENWHNVWTQGHWQDLLDLLHSWKPAIGCNHVMTARWSFGSVMNRYESLAKKKYLQNIFCKSASVTQYTNIVSQVNGLTSVHNLLMDLFLCVFRKSIYYYTIHITFSLLSDGALIEHNECYNKDHVSVAVQ